ncbi:hypothetical protein E2542_SST15835 [Spatholobus suberectus]|nr:hypothetical protein E2542_SST15835 [Spatholobus suberectus]
MKIPFFQGQFDHGIKLFNSSMKIEKYSPSHSACFNLNYLEEIYRCVNAVSSLVKVRAGVGVELYDLSFLHIDWPSLYPMDGLENEILFTIVLHQLFCYNSSEQCSL